jgi:hypothetical protein
MQPVVTPAKMFKPVLSAWVKQRHTTFCQWIDTRYLVAFVSIADRARQPKIVFVICTPSGARHDMFNFEARHDQMLWA